MTLTPNTQITQENVEALEVALSRAKRGADKAGCDGWRAQEMCRQIVQLLEPVVNRPALSPPAEGADPFYEVSDEKLPGMNYAKPGWLARSLEAAKSEVPFAAEDACLACNSPAPVDHIGDATEKVDWARCQRCGGEIQGWICQQCHQEFEENDASELVFCPSESVDWTVVGPKLVEALRPFAEINTAGWADDSPVDEMDGLTAQHLRDARAALAAAQPGDRT